MIPHYLSLAAFSCLGFASAEPAFHVPLTRRREPLSIENYVIAGNALRIKYGHANLPSKRQNTATTPLIDQNHDTTYTGAIQIGTPPQSLNVILATGTGDLWVSSPSCTACSPDAPAFNSAVSDTLQVAQNSTGQPVRVTISYGSDSVAGDLVRDTVAMGGFQVKLQPWLRVDQISPNLVRGTTSGVLGLGFDALAEIGATPFWETLADSGQLATPEMSFWFTRLNGDPNASGEEFGGIFTLGGRNQTMYTGDVEFYPLVTIGGRKTYWLLNVSGVRANGKDIALPPDGIGAVETGTTLIGGPTAAISAIYAQIPGSQPLTGDLAGYYGFPCTTIIEVSMAFGGKYWPINAQDANIGPLTNDSDNCLGAFFAYSAGGAGGPTWVLGTTFLKNVYTVLRSQPTAIGFAELNNSPGLSSGGPTGGNGNNTSDEPNGSAGTSGATLPQISPVILLATAASLFVYLSK